MEPRGRSLSAPAAVPVHLVDPVRPVVGAHDRALALVLDCQDHRVIEHLALSDGELDDNAHAGLVVQGVAVVWAHAYESWRFASAATSSSTDDAIWNARVNTAA